MGLTFTTAFIAGMLSFISPCILPLAPGYVAMISGVSVEELRERQHGILWRVLLNALLFVLGFSILFVALGASAGVAGRFLSAHRELLNRIAGGCADQGNDLVEAVDQYVDVGAVSVDWANRQSRPGRSGIARRHPAPAR